MQVRISVKLIFFLGIILFGVVFIFFEISSNSGDGPRPSKQTQKKLFNRVRPPIDCVRLIEGDEAEQRRAENYQKRHAKKAISNAQYINMTRDCFEFIESRGYITSSTTEEEEHFSFAIGITIYHEVELFERLLRAIYRPQNVYCIHVDKKSAASYHKAISEIAGCFSNIFVLPNNVKVQWGKFSNLETEILCMEALLRYKKWKYFINLTGQEFPLKTNWELVQIIKALNGTNIIGATTVQGNRERWAGRPPAPSNITPIKGPVNVVARREFVEYAINNETGQQLLNWSKLVDFPDEIYFSTLNHNPHLGIPGSYLGTPEYISLPTYPLISRLKIWDEQRKFHGLPCHGFSAQGICIFSVGDLPLLATTPNFFANKFYVNYHPLALDCLEELIYNRTQQELLGDRYFNTSYYENLDVAKNHL